MTGCRLRYLTVRWTYVLSLPTVGTQKPFGVSFMSLHMDSLMTTCPYCGERFEVLVDASVPEQEYIEDCFVCCRPIEFSVTVDPVGDIQLLARHENDC